MSDRIVKIGGATAFASDSAMGLTQFLGMDAPPQYLLFDMLSEGVMPYLGRASSLRASEIGDGGYTTTFVDLYVLPFLRDFLASGMKLIANAGGLNGKACARAIIAGATSLGCSPKIAVIDGDDLRHRADEFKARGLVDMFSGEPIARLLDGGGTLLSMSAYIGAFPVAQALAQGADIVIVGRAVDSAAALGPLIHEFGWGPDNFDELAGGTLCGHLIECSAQVTGGTFTDWKDVPDWANIGFPIAECRSDGSFVLTKPDGTGGLVSEKTCAEQLIYEVSDPQAYIVPDVVCDFSQVQLRTVGPDRVEVSDARGRSRTDSYKVSFTLDDGWRASVMFPIIGRDAVLKAEKTGEAMLGRTRDILRAQNLAPWRQTRIEAIGGEAIYGPGATAAARSTREVICRIVADHDEQRGAQCLLREQSSIISHMAPGTSVATTVEIRPVTQIGAFLLPKDEVLLTLHIEDWSVACPISVNGKVPPPDRPQAPLPPEDLDGGEVPLIALAYARSGDKGDLFNVGVMARDPEYLPFIHAALDDKTVLDHYRHLALEPAKVSLERYFIPGIAGINFVVRGCMQGGIGSSMMLDPAAKGMAQILLDHPVAISRRLRDRADIGEWLVLDIPSAVAQAAP